jgi:hypothetical protein
MSKTSGPPKHRANQKLVLAAVLLGAAAIGSLGGPADLAAAQKGPGAASSPAQEVVPVSDVLKAVQASQSLQSVPKDLRPGLTVNDQANPNDIDIDCHSARPNKADVPFYAFGACTFGDLTASKLMVVYGDSHAPMWGDALQGIAERTGWRLVAYYLWDCPAPNFSYILSDTKSAGTRCSEFHAIAPPLIDSLHPQLVIVTSEAGYQSTVPGKVISPARWEAGWVNVLKSLKRPGTRLVMIGDIPQWSDDYPYCLAAHMSDLQACAATPQEAVPYNVPAERSAAAAMKVQYISPEPWICAGKCEPIIDGLRVFNDQYHLTSTYVQYLSGALQQALGLPDAKR